MAYEFHYTPTGTGVISGKEVLEQTEDAINDLGNTAISGVQEALDKAEQALTNSENAVDDAQTALNTANNAEGVAIQAQNDVSNLSGTVTNIGNRVTTAEGNIGNLQGRMTTAEGNITNLQDRMTTAEGNIGNLQTAVSTAQATANSAQQTATTARQQSYVFRYSSTALTPSSTNSNTLLDNTDNLKVGDKVIDSSGVLFSITAIDTVNSTFTIGTALIDLANDSDVVHNTGDENVNGIKTFKDMIPIDGDYLGDEASTNQRTNICLRANRDTADKSGAYITRFRQNRAQGALQPLDLQKIGFDVLENEVRTNNVFDIQCTDWLNDVPQRVNFVSSAQSYSYGRSTNKALINDLNPGCLSLPDLDNGIDISSYITLNSDSSYTPLSNGYVYICCYSSSACGLWVRDTNNNGVSTRSIGSVPTYNNLVSIYIPVVKNVSLSIFTPGCENILTAKFYPCQGNV